MNEKDFLLQLKKAVLSYDDKAQLILFGSRARGDFKQDSDWDILILTPHVVDADYRNNLTDLIFDTELKYAQQVSTLVINQTSWEEWEILPLYKNIQKEGVLV